MLVVMHIAPGTTPYTFLVPYGVSHLGIKSPAAAADLLVQKRADTQPPFSYLTVMAEGTVHVLTHVMLMGNWAGTASVSFHLLHRYICGRAAADLRWRSFSLPLGLRLQRLRCSAPPRRHLPACHVCNYRFVLRALAGSDSRRVGRLRVGKAILAQFKHCASKNLPHTTLKILVQVSPGISTAHTEKDIDFIVYQRLCSR